MDKRELTVITEESIRDFDSTIRSPGYFIRHIFYYLRAHPELMNQSDYNRLYFETLNFQIHKADSDRNWSKEFLESERQIIEFLADLVNQYGEGCFEKYSKKQIDEYLEYRRSVWNKNA